MVVGGGGGGGKGVLKLRFDWYIMKVFVRNLNSIKNKQ